MPTVCKRVYYSGHVQGVGFRYTAQGLARGYPVTGYVRNLSSGEVELVAEGEPVPVDAFLAAVARQMAGSITHTVVHEDPPLGFPDFRIRR
jgi:acylphosphatase